MTERFKINGVQGVWRCQLAIMDRSSQTLGSPGAQATHWLDFDAAKLTADVDYDAEASTIRIIGSIPLTGDSTVKLSFQDQQVDFPVATVAFELSVPRLLSFDTGQLILEAGKTLFSPPAISVNGNCVITAGDEKIVEKLSYALKFRPNAIIVKQTGNSLNITHSNTTSQDQLPPILTVKAKNGTTFTFVPGISDGAYQAEWSLITTAKGAQ